MVAAADAAQSASASGYVDTSTSTPDRRHQRLSRLTEPVLRALRGCQLLVLCPGVLAYLTCERQRHVTSVKSGP